MSLADIICKLSKNMERKDPAANHRICIVASGCYSPWAEQMAMIIVSAIVEHAKKL